MNETIKCKGCGESWDESTPGYIGAFRKLGESKGMECPSCTDFGKANSPKIQFVVWKI